MLLIQTACDGMRHPAGVKAVQFGRVFSVQPRLEDGPLVPMEPTTVRARDGLELPCYLSRSMENGTAPVWFDGLGKGLHQCRQYGMGRQDA
jgi:hypothetical protein